MQNSHFEIYVHLVWAVKNREAMINTFLEKMIENICRDKAIANKAELICFGNTENHVHILVSLHPNTTIPKLVKDMKASSSYHINKETNYCLYWQDGYGAFSVSKNLLEKVEDYILKQKEHHSNENIIKYYENTGFNQ